MIRGCGMFAVVLGFAWSAAAPAAEEIVIDRDNITISQSVKIKPGAYRVKDADNNGVLQIKGDNVVVDFQNATLAAVEMEGADLSKAEGIGIAIDGAKNVTLLNAKVHGYFFNIRALKSPGLKLEGCDASFSRAQRIAADGQSIEIWLHLRGLEAWRSYGAGIWIEGCDKSVVRTCRAGGAQDGLLLIDSAECTITDCDFSYNSGFGIGLWGSARNVVSWNYIDFVNRPWGGGWGGDSAALVIVSDSNENFLVGNSMTHGGDGLFLTDRVNGGLDGEKKTSNFQGSCNNNVVAHNDGSWSTANAYEATFSFGNIYYKNIGNDSNYGFWLGFSSDSLLLENEVLRPNYECVAIEHGHGNRIEGNTFAEARGAAVAMWSGTDWVDKLHPSRDLDIRDNVIRNCGRAFRLDNSTDVAVSGNKIEKAPETPFEYVDRPSPGAPAKFKASEAYKRLEKIVAAKPKGFTMLRDGTGPKGIEWLQSDDFAPRDYRGKLVACRRKDARTLELMPLVPGELKFTTPDWITVTEDKAAKRHYASAKDPSGAGEWKRYTIQVKGGKGEQTQKIDGAFLTAQWDVRWFRWDQPAKLAYDDAAGWAKLFESKPLLQQKTFDLSKALWEHGFPEGIPHSHFAILGKTSIKFPAGRYKLMTSSDDGIRVFVDGKEVISRWNNHSPTGDEAEVDLTEGVHEFVVHYCQEGGASALSIGWQKVAKNEP